MGKAMKISSKISRNGLWRCIRVAATGMAMVLAPLAATAVMTSHATVAEAAGMQKFLRIGLNKSVIIRLPRNASDVLIGDDRIVKAVIRSKRVAYIFGREMGQTNIFFLDTQGRQILALDVEVSKDVSALQQLLRRSMPKARIKVDMVGDKIVLRGTARDPAEAKRAVDLAARFARDPRNVVNAITISGKEQVTLKVKIAEVQRTVAKQFGINWQRIIENSDFRIDVLMANPFSLGQVLGTGLTSSNSTLSNLGLTAPGIGGTSASGKTAAVLRALERDGIVRLLAEPTLTAISGEAANFLVGGEVPLPTGYDLNTGTVTYAMKPFGVALGFTPIVHSPGRISLKIKTEVSEVSTRFAQSLGGITIPGLEKRSAQTTVEVPSGGTLAIGGLIKDQTKQNIDGVPGVKNLPILGALFRSRDYLRDQTELVIFVTPYLVKPVSEKKLRTPLDGLNVATDGDTIFMGRLHRVYGAPSGPKGGSRVYHGDVGFIVE
ncbi:MAG TPA: type II and III secretion system protein family protein [Thermopetrobacter sp.]|nr:type II and III secretion system protein family protein [Thermopetrobacter sp.]